MFSVISGPKRCVAVGITLLGGTVALTGGNAVECKLDGTGPKAEKKIDPIAFKNPKDFTNYLEAEIGKAPALAQPLIRAFLADLYVEVDGRTLLDEMFLSMDRDGSGSVTVSEVLAILNSVRGLKVEGFNTEEKTEIPERLEYEEGHTVRPRVQEYMKTHGPALTQLARLAERWGAPIKVAAL